MTGRARILRAGTLGDAGETAGAPPILALAPVASPSPGVRRIHRAEVEAKLQGARILERARAEAASIVAAARRQVEAEVQLAIEQARATAVSQAMAEWLAVRADDQRRIDRDGDRAASLATAMAERLLGAALALRPARIAEIAQVVLSEARGARRATIDAHPEDAADLRRHLSVPGFEEGALAIREDPSLRRGDLRVHTDRGSLDARLGPRLEQLASAMRDALSNPEDRR